MTAPQNAPNEPRAAVSPDLRACEWCGKGFEPYRSWDRFCRSGGCKREFEAAARRLGEQQLALRLESRGGLARATDPVSSHEAAVEAAQAGTRQRDMGRALSLVQAHPGLSAFELGLIAVRDYPQWWGTNHSVAYHAIARRLGPDLRDREGLVCNRRDGDQQRQHEEPDRHKVEGCRGTPVEWWARGDAA
jgi:hypothetical protein